MAEPYFSDGGGSAAAVTTDLPYPPGSVGGSEHPTYPALDAEASAGDGDGDGAPAGGDGRGAEPPPEAPWLQEGIVQLWPHISLIIEVRPPGGGGERGEAMACWKTGGDGAP